MSANGISQSPSGPFTTPRGVVDFPSAIAEIINGKQITKEEWNDPDSCCMLRDNYLMIRRDGTWHKWIISDGDLLGEDWIVLE